MGTEQSVWVRTGNCTGCMAPREDCFDCGTHRAEANRQGIRIIVEAQTPDPEASYKYIVLGKMPRQWQEYATWAATGTSGLCMGHYFTSFDAALADLTERVARGY